LLGATIVPLLIPHRLSRLPAWWPMWLRGGLGSPTLWMALLGPALAAALLYVPLEARRRTMLGDTGANALGALLGVAACALLPLAGQAVLAVGLVGLNL